MAQIIVQGKELEADFFDADFMERYEAATRDLHKKATDESNRKHEKVSDAFRAQCEVAREYFDRVFGEGTADMLFGEKRNLKTHMEAIAELTEYAARSKKEVNDLANKYTQRSKAFNRHSQAQFVSHKHKKH